MLVFNIITCLFNNNLAKYHFYFMQKPSQSLIIKVVRKNSILLFSKITIPRLTTPRPHHLPLLPLPRHPDGPRATPETTLLARGGGCDVDSGGQDGGGRGYMPSYVFLSCPCCETRILVVLALLVFMEIYSSLSWGKLRIWVSSRTITRHHLRYNLELQILTPLLVNYTGPTHRLARILTAITHHFEFIRYRGWLYWAIAQNNILIIMTQFFSWWEIGQWTSIFICKFLSVFCL